MESYLYVLIASDINSCILFTKSNGILFCFIHGFDIIIYIYIKRILNTIY